MPDDVATPDDEPLWTVRRAAEYCGVSVWTVYNWLYAGNFVPCYKLAARAGSPEGVVRFRRRDVVAWVEARRAAGETLPGKRAPRPSRKRVTEPAAG